MRTVALLALASIVSFGAEEKAAPKKSKPATTQNSTKKSTPHKSAAHKSAAHSKAAPKAGKSASKTGKSSKTGAKRGKGTHGASQTTWRSRQLAPTPDRYKEIQSALAERGYLKRDPTGVWDADSADALRRFQQDQSLDATGKVNSLSLIALGLGPKHSPPPAAAPSAPQTKEPPAPVASPPASDPPATTPTGPAAIDTQP